MSTRLELPEKVYMQSIVDLARILGWRVYHPWSSMYSAAGWPDVTLVRGNRLVFAELKAARGKVSRAQEEWLEALSAVPCAETYLWVAGRDSLQDIAAVLRRD